MTDHRAITDSLIDADAALIAAYVRERDLEAMAQLFRAHAAVAYRVALRALGHPADAEDAVQAAFVQVMAHAIRFRYNASVRTWILSITINECRQRLRQAQREKRRRVPLSEASCDVQPPSIDDEPRAHLQHALLALPESFRSALTLHFLEGLFRTARSHVHFPFARALRARASVER